MKTQGVATLVETFQKGVTDDRLARNLIRKIFDTLERAVEYATEEQVAERTFEMYRNHPVPEPMEVDVVQNNGTEESLGAIQKSIKELNVKLERVAKQVKRPTNNPNHVPVPSRPNPPFGRQQTPYVPNGPVPDVTVPPPPFVPAPAAATKYRWTADGRPICAACGRTGHVQRRCRSQQMRGN